MIAKVGSSTSIANTGRYLQANEERVAWKESHNLAAADQQFVDKQMQQVAAMSRTDEPIYHYSISWDESDNPTRKQMKNAARATLNDLGLSDHQALIVAHNDKHYKHVHVMVNRVHPTTGKAWDRWMDYRKLEKSLRSIERDYGWKEVPGHHYRLEGQKKPAFGRSYNRMEAAKMKNGHLPFSTMVKEVAEHEFRAAEHWKDLHERLAEYGLTIQRGDRGTGGKITDGNNVTNLSKVHRDFSMNKLTDRLGPFKSFQEYRKEMKLTKNQQTFVRFERSLRLNRPGQHADRKRMHQMMKALGTANQVRKTLGQLLKTTTPQNPAFKITKAIGKKVISALHKQQQQTHERQR